MAKRRCLKRGKSRRVSRKVAGPCLKWARGKSTARKTRKKRRSTSKGGTCISIPGAFRMKTKAGYKCACVVKTKGGGARPKFLPHSRCARKGTRAMSYSSAKSMAGRKAPFAKAKW